MTTAATNYALEPPRIRKPRKSREFHDSITILPSTGGRVAEGGNGSQGRASPPAAPRTSIRRIRHGARQNVTRHPGRVAVRLPAQIVNLMRAAELSIRGRFEGGVIRGIRPAL